MRIGSDRPNVLSQRLAHLSPNELAALHQRLRMKRAGAGVETPERIERHPRDGRPFPVSHAQKRLWLFEQLWPGTPTYNVPAAVRLTGGLCPASLAQGVREVVRRHESLRTRFELAGKEPVQWIEESVDVPVPTVDLSGLAREEGREEVDRLVAAHSLRPFDPRRAPLLDLVLLRQALDEHVLCIDIHHLVCDHWSQVVFVRDLAGVYRAFHDGLPSSLPEPPIQYADFAHWHRGWLDGDRLETQLAYWKGALEGVPPLLELPTDRPRPPRQSFRGGVHTESFDLPSLEAVVEAEKVTPFMLLLTAVKLLLAYVSGRKDLVVGSPILGRTRAGTEDLIGFFSNTLPLRTDLADATTLRDALGQVRQGVLGAFAHPDVPFDRLLEELRIERDPSHPPLIQVNFVVQRDPSGGVALPGLDLRPLEQRQVQAKFDLNFFLSEGNGRLTVSLQYNRDVFEAETAADLVRLYAVSASALATEPGLGVAQLFERLAGQSRRRRSETGRRLKETNRLKLDRLRRPGRGPAAQTAETRRPETLEPTRRPTGRRGST